MNWGALTVTVEMRTTEKWLTSTLFSLFLMQTSESSVCSLLKRNKSYFVVCCFCTELVSVFECVRENNYLFISFFLTVGHPLRRGGSGIWPSLGSSQYNHICRREQTLCQHIWWQESACVGMVSGATAHYHLNENGLFIILILLLCCAWPYYILCLTAEYIMDYWDGQNSNGFPYVFWRIYFFCRGRVQ